MAQLDLMQMPKTPILVDTIAVDGARFATLIVERDSNFPSSRDTLNILISNPDGSEERTIELTSVNIGGIVGRGVAQDPFFTHIGGGDIVVLYQEDTFNGGDGLWYITSANSDGTIGVTFPINTNGVLQSFTRPQIIALTDSAGDLNGEFVLSYHEPVNDEIFIQRYSGTTGFLVGDPIFIPTEFAGSYSIELLDANRFLVNFVNTSGSQEQIIYAYDEVPDLLDAAGNYIGTVGNDNLARGFDGTTGYYFSSGIDTLIENNIDDGAFIDFGGQNDTFLSSLGNITQFTDGLTIDGGSGFDVYDASFATVGQNITVDFASGGVITVDNVLGSQTIMNVESFIGGEGDDDIRGDSNANTISGGNGRDLLSGRGGNDTVIGGGGDDIIFAGGQNDLVFAGGENDFIIGEGGNDTLNGEAGNDVFYQWNHNGAGTDTIDGGSGFDTIRMQVYNASGEQEFSDVDFTYTFTAPGAGTITGANETINFSEIEQILDGVGNSNYNGSSGNDVFFGNSGEDVINGGDGVDFLDGGADNDRFLITDAGDLFGGSLNIFGSPFAREVISGGSGVDRIVFSFADGDELELDEADVSSIEEIEFAQSGSQGAENGVFLNGSQLGGNGFSSSLNVIGSNAQGGFVDIISIRMDSNTFTNLSGWTFENWGRDGQEINVIGNDDRQVLNGTSQDDNINLRGGNDTIDAGTGNDTIDAGTGHDRIIGGLGIDTIDGGADNDTVIAIHNDGDDTYTGGSGFDILDFSAVQGVVQINQLGGVITGSAGNDTLMDVFEQIIGSNFDDVLSGGNGGDVLDGGGGNDQFFANGGDDLVRGGEDNDTIFHSTNDGNDRLEGGAGFDVLDYSSLQGVVQVNQLDGTTTGTANNDILLDVFEAVIGSNFGDVLSGGNGINVLNGGGGDDQLFANGGNDQTSGGAGNDTITLGAGDDRHDYRNGEDVDTILDFNAGAGSEDQIILTFHSAATSFTQMQMAGMFSQQGLNTQIDLGSGDMIILNNINVGDLHEDDFIF